MPENGQISDKDLSRYLSYVLRHKPEAISLTMSPDGWVSVDELLAKLRDTEFPNVTFEDLQRVVQNNDKKRFALSEDGTAIRASQGHSISIDLGLEKVQPPKILYHGTATRFLEAIAQSGLMRMNRDHVHLSATSDTARSVGIRHGKPVILQIQAADMHEDGYDFYVSANGVWLTNEVPVKYIRFPE